MPRQAFVLLALAAALSGCSKHATEPAPVPPPPVPELVASQPPARASGVLYDSDIWAQFSRPLDTRTVSPLSVFLKLDAQRLPITVSYDAITRRISLRPSVTLLLQRTYTVEFSTAVHGADGTPIAEGVFFQFTTNSLRRVPYDYPPAGALEGPVSALGWGGGKGADGNILHEVYVSTDSSQVESRAVVPFARSVFTYYLPVTAWPLGSTVYWAITSENVTTHERLAGPVQSFRIVDAGTPMDSLTILALDHGSNDARTRPFPAYCNRGELPCGPNFNGSLHWYYADLPGNVRFAGATLRLTAQDAYSGMIAASAPTLWMAQQVWLPCSVGAPGPPFPEVGGLLAGAGATSPNLAEFSSDRLSAYFEAQYRGRAYLYGTIVRADQDIFFHSTLSADLSTRPRAVVRFYRLPTAVAP